MEGRGPARNYDEEEHNPFAGGGGAGGGGMGVVDVVAGAIIARVGCASGRGGNGGEQLGDGRAGGGGSGERE